MAQKDSSTAILSEAEAKQIGSFLAQKSFPSSDQNLRNLLEKVETIISKMPDDPSKARNKSLLKNLATSMKFMIIKSFVLKIKDLDPANTSSIDSFCEEVNGSFLSAAFRTPAARLESPPESYGAELNDFLRQKIFLWYIEGAYSLPQGSREPITLFVLSAFFSYLADIPSKEILELRSPKKTKFLALMKCIKTRIFSHLGQGFPLSSVVADFTIWLEAQVQDLEDQDRQFTLAYFLLYITLQLQFISVCPDRHSKALSSFSDLLHALQQHHCTKYYFPQTVSPSNFGDLFLFLSWLPQSYFDSIKPDYTIPPILTINFTNTLTPALMSTLIHRHPNREQIIFALEQLESKIPALSRSAVRARNFDEMPCFSISKYLSPKASHASASLLDTSSPMKDLARSLDPDLLRAPSKRGELYSTATAVGPSTQAFKIKLEDGGAMALSSEA